jgi:hypothetical protein
MITIKDVPTKASASQDWLIFYNSLKSRYGAERAEAAFALAWSKRGNPDIAAEVENKTSFKIDKSFVESLQSTGFSIVDTGSSFFSFASTGAKVVYGSVIFLGVGAILLLGYKIYQASSSDVGNAVGVAAKAYTGKIA